MTGRRHTTWRPAGHRHSPTHGCVDPRQYRPRDAAMLNLPAVGAGYRSLGSTPECWRPATAPSPRRPGSYSPRGPGAGLYPNQARLACARTRGQLAPRSRLFGTFGLSCPTRGVIDALPLAFTELCVPRPALRLVGLPRFGIAHNALPPGGHSCALFDLCFCMSSRVGFSQLPPPLPEAFGIVRAEYRRELGIGVELGA